MLDLPTGTVTFLLTDVEGSTALLERDAGAMRQAMDVLDALIQDCVQRHGGVVMRARGEGDSSFSVFAGAVDGVMAASSLQDAMLATSWPTASPLRLRIALHSGEVERREGDVLGTAVNRCARLRDAGHGGQTLLSSVTCSLVREILPIGMTMRDLGAFRLAGLARTERVYQLVSPGQPDAFPPIKLPAVRRPVLPIP